MLLLLLLLAAVESCCVDRQLCCHDHTAMIMTILDRSSE
jgi:hypothetical protein